MNHINPALASHLQDLAAWKRVRKYMSRKNRRNTFLGLDLVHRRVMVGVRPEWCPPFRGHG